MATVSSHILDSVTGKSAIGIRVQLIHIAGDAKTNIVFDMVSDQDGRIVKQVEAEDGEYELTFHLAEYFSIDDTAVTKAVIRFSMSDRQARYHMPLMLSPHSYSLWWSE